MVSKSGKSHEVKPFVYGKVTELLTLKPRDSECIMLNDKALGMGDEDDEDSGGVICYVSKIDVKGNAIEICDA